MVKLARRTIDRSLEQKRLADLTVQREGKELKKAKREVKHFQEAQATLQAVAETIQQRAHKQIADIVSRCLAGVFEEPYVFEILFERKRGRTEARAIFRRGDLEIDPLSAAGGGVVDVAAFALRLSCLLLSRPPLRRVLILDEPFRFVSEDYRPQVRELLELLSKELKVQILLVTHSEEFKIGKVVEL